MAENRTRAASYVRAARSKRKARSFCSQMDCIQDYAVQSDADIVREYSDVGASSAPRRRGLFRLEADARLGVFNMLIVAEAGRLYRNKKQLEGFVARLKRLGVTVMAVDAGVLSE